VSFTIRKAHAEDADAVLYCLHTAFEPYRAYYSDAGYANSTLTGETIHQRMREMTVFVAEDMAGIAIGTIAGSLIGQSGAREGHIRGMAVLPNWQGRGVADELLAAVEAELLEQGCSRITLDTTQPLQRAIKFYERNGFRATGIVRDFHGMPLYEYAKEY
jgi:ribosomal protein S18 acetylase RimI-like enzyme